MIDRTRIEKIKALFPQVSLDDRFSANGEARSLPLSLAPPPPPEDIPVKRSSRPRGEAIDYTQQQANEARARAARNSAKSRAQAKREQSLLPTVKQADKAPVLNAPQCAEVKRRLADGDFISDIARDFGVSRDCIYLIRQTGTASRPRGATRKPDPSCPHAHTTKHGRDAYGKPRKKCHDCGKVWRVEQAA